MGGATWQTTTRTNRERPATSVSPPAARGLTPFWAADSIRIACICTKVAPAPGKRRSRFSSSSKASGGGSAYSTSRCRKRAANWRWLPSATAGRWTGRSEEHTSELQSLMRSSYAVFCLKKKKQRHENVDVQNTTHIYRQQYTQSDTVQPT